MSAHTPTKYHVRPQTAFTPLQLERLQTEIRLHLREGDADVVLLAVNAHAALVEALSELWEQTAKSGWHNAEPVPSRRKARAKLLSNAPYALALARGEA